MTSLLSTRWLFQATKTHCWQFQRNEVRTLGTSCWSSMNDTIRRTWWLWPSSAKVFVLVTLLLVQSLARCALVKIVIFPDQFITSAKEIFFASVCYFACLSVSVIDKNLWMNFEIRWRLGWHNKQSVTFWQWRGSELRNICHIRVTEELTASWCAACSSLDFTYCNVTLSTVTPPTSLVGSRHCSSAAPTVRWLPSAACATTPPFVIRSSGLFCGRPGSLELVTRLPLSSNTFCWQFSSWPENSSVLVLLAYTAH